jgi:pyruvate ferredoxin oxidoreductase delta subunit
MTEKKGKFPTEDQVKKPQNYQDIPIAGTITNPGSAMFNKTGSWRSFRPIHDRAKCINCMICFSFCPEDAILVKDGKVVGVNLDYCKGCGICAKECPVKAFAMKEESEFRKE